MIGNSDLFDREWYLSQYSDASNSNLTPEQHYLDVGAEKLYDPSPIFSTLDYLRANPDVAAAGINPLLHYLRFGKLEGRALRPATATDKPEATAIQHVTKLSDPVQSQEITRPSTKDIKKDNCTDAIEIVDVVIAVHNALDDVKRCLYSLRSVKSKFATRAIIVNDGSDEKTSTWLRYAAKNLNNNNFSIDLIENECNLGYTKTVNVGLRASSAEYVVTLNSDTIVTDFWLDLLVECLESNPKIGIAGPLSNAASWQNVPSLYDSVGNFAINSIPASLSPSEMAEIVRRASKKTYPKTNFVNGFCFMIRRSVINSTGYMDEDAFPMGYGEENDYCIRAADAGFSLAYCDTAYVFHAKSKSFGSERRKILSKQGSDAIQRTHGADKYKRLVAEVKDTSKMDAVRDLVQLEISKDHDASALDGAVDYLTKQRILFLLPVKGGSGGAHSVVQEAYAMLELGVFVRIGIRVGTMNSFLNQYHDLPMANNLFVEVDDTNIIHVASGFDVVVATIFSSMKWLQRIRDVLPGVIPAYYAQDYEPLFFEPGSDLAAEAHASYTQVDGCLIFAKTDWICRTIEANHHVEVKRVIASIDHNLYYPNPTAKRKRSLEICAMIRPSTPRRGAKRTMQLLSKIKSKFGHAVTVTTFGCDPNTPEYIELPGSREFENLGVLKRPGVARVLQDADIFIDMSDYQAFGRTALEAMACGTVPVVPTLGGADEFAINGRNSLAVDTMNVDAAFEMISDLISDPDRLERMKLDAIETAQPYSPRRAAISELRLFAETRMGRGPICRSSAPRKKVFIVTARTKEVKGLTSATGSGYVRLIQPYSSDAVSAEFDVQFSQNGELPKPDVFDVVIIQRNLVPSASDIFEIWHDEFRAWGGRLIYEIDDDLFDGAALKARGYTGDTDLLAQSVKKLANYADVITVSTKNLQERFEPWSEKVICVPNYIDSQLWPIEKEFTGGVSAYNKPPNQIRIGYMGTATHHEDLKLIHNDISRIISDYGDDVDVEVIGAFQDSRALFGRRLGLPRNREYPNFCKWISKVVDWDIALIPLDGGSFNEAKSFLKFLECAALNVAIVCTDNSEYRNVAKDGQNCLLVGNNEGEWYDAIRKLIEDPNLRLQLASAARQDVLQRYTVKANQQVYISVLKAALSAGEYS